MLYTQGPHAALYTPLCKVMDVLEECQYLVSTDGQRLSALVAYSDDSIEYTWSLAGRAETLRNLIVQVQHRLGALPFLPVMETGRRSWSQLLGLPLLGRYFRAYLPKPTPPQVGVPAGFEIIPFNPQEDVEEANRLMNHAYPSLRRLTSPGRLREMMQTSFYFPAGWFFLRHEVSGRRVGLAICGYGQEMEEGFIDWIQIAPRFRHQGLGAVLVRESIRRLCDKSRFITASGSLDAPFVLGELYSECGFEQMRQWTILGQSSGVADRRQAFMIPPGGPAR